MNYMTLTTFGVAIMKKIYTYEYKINLVKTFLKSQQADNELSIAGFVKQETTYYLWQKYGLFLSKQYWKKRIFP